MKNDYTNEMNATVEKGILYLPAEFPTEEGRLFLSRGFNDCAALFTPGQWNALSDKLGQMPEVGRKRQLQQFFMAYGAYVDVVDRKIELPAIFLQHFLREGSVRIKPDERGYYALIQEDE